jgi:PIN domain nuclease of toxin-antitoxin system
VVLTSLPFHHRDPFDRILIAQAISEGIPILSEDPAFRDYPVQIVW